MKEYIKYLINTIGAVIMLYLSYQLSFIINGFYSLDVTFKSALTNEFTYFYLIIIKGLIFLLSLIIFKKYVPVMLAFIGTLLGNLGAFFYMVMIMDIFPDYIVLSVNFAIDLILIMGVTILVDFISKQIIIEDDIHEEQVDNINKSNIDQISMTNEIMRLTDEINNKNILLEQLDEQIQKSQKNLSKMQDYNYKINDQFKFDNTGETADAIEESNTDFPVIQPSVKEAENTLNDKSNLENESEKIESVGIYSRSNTFELPLRIEIGDKAKRVPSKHNEERRHKIKEERIKKENELKMKEQDLNERIEQLSKKEEIIEKTIANLEQISKSIKERMKILDEKENYVRNQMEKFEEDQNQESYALHKQIYETIFKSPDITEEEIKLQDNDTEIIINKNDLDEIRKLIEGSAY